MDSSMESEVSKYIRRALWGIVVWLLYYDTENLIFQPDLEDSYENKGAQVWPQPNLSSLSSLSSIRISSSKHVGSRRLIQKCNCTQKYASLSCLIRAVSILDQRS
jgi:hypothetical protein